MSSDTLATRKKRPAPDSPAAPEGDHRKRRRNRTTQSCLNCHTSKRMCDRKRPACARCTQLGLTGLCVYEVDDPNQRSDTQDESARLLKRVAELEGVIRELKNKPHPRWVQGTNGPTTDLEKWTTRTHPQAASEGGQDQANSNAPSPPSSLSEKSELSSPRTRAPLLANGYLPTISLNTGNRRSSRTALSSPQSTPSPTLITPTDEFARSHISVAVSPDVSQEYDLSSMFLTYPEFMGCEAGSFGTLNKESEPCFLKPNMGHCGCPHEAPSYNVLLELSLRLRRAADVLSRSASHQLGHRCSLHQRIAELDVLTTNALGSVSTLPEDLPAAMISRSDGTQSLGNSVQLHSSQSFAHPCRTTISPESLQSLRSPPSCEDPFMTWEPPRRP
ncbi:hypothetical protein P691DRAFT_798133 [Macrolepiota fuliginosa MF-IS2]|uniref:Zn(2)-C6 fungal-type domain-containing protein n=1 Tax=Macrolepiota fuliginosa MF-IS2 TaxID=1400762 RepID=A0A9P6C389_9AGAR|nr:hypothetical protein P691DRAFT_798133 [Macrolepiota fuliginosa MF-IS2]